LLARCALCAIFVRSGIRALNNPGWQVERATQSLPDLPEPHFVARAQAAVQVASSAALMVDIFPRVAAGALAATLIPVTYVGHPFWTIEDPQARNQQVTHFLKNLGLFGALLLVAVPEQPEP
jgi:uncharacterized membrane protein YphA (DoxX/SURF4 family)